MSYCRWSSDDFQCDVYVYESVYEVWEIHVAGRRRDWAKAGVKLPGPIPEDLRGASDVMFAQEWLARSAAVNELMDDPRWDDDDFEGWVDVPGPHAGKSYNCETPGDCADLLEVIRASGCVVPQYAIDALREEQQAEEGE